MKRLFWLVTLVCLLALNAAPIFAQFETASVLGYVRDASGAVMPNASVTLMNQQTKATVVVKTNAQGAFQFGQFRPVGRVAGVSGHETRNLSRRAARPS